MPVSCTQRTLSPYFHLNTVDVVVQEQDENGITKVCLELEGATTLKKDKSEWRNYYR